MTWPWAVVIVTLCITTVALAFITLAYISGKRAFDQEQKVKEQFAESLGRVSGLLTTSAEAPRG